MDGIRLYYSQNNTISGNTINGNVGNGISLDHSNDNSVSGNTMNNNNPGGIWLSYSFGNKIYLNCFTNNTLLNAFDGPSSDNQWDNGVMGNYWADYSGTDENGDGIGDTSYYISGSSGSQDNFPLMNCPIPAQAGGGIPIVLIISISVISGGAVIGVATLLLIRHRKLRME